MQAVGKGKLVGQKRPHYRGRRARFGGFHFSRPLVWSGLVVVFIHIFHCNGTGGQSFVLHAGHKLVAVNGGSCLELEAVSIVYNDIAVQDEIAVFCFGRIEAVRAFFNLHAGVNIRIVFFTAVFAVLEAGKLKVGCLQKFLPVGEVHQMAVFGPVRAVANNGHRGRGGSPGKAFAAGCGIVGVYGRIKAGQVRIGVAGGVAVVSVGADKPAPGLAVIVA